VCSLVQLEPSDQIALIAAGFSQLLCLRIASEFAAVSRYGGRLLPIGGGLAVMLPHSLREGTTNDAQSTDDIYSVFESIVQFSVELSKLDLDVTETAMFAAATLVQPGLYTCIAHSSLASKKIIKQLHELDL